MNTHISTEFMKYTFAFQVCLRVAEDLKLNVSIHT